MVFYREQFLKIFTGEVYPPKKLPTFGARKIAFLCALLLSPPTPSLPFITVALPTLCYSADTFHLYVANKHETQS